MTSLTASQLLVSYAEGPAQSPALSRPLADALRGLARRLAPARRGPTFAAMPAHLLRDIGLDGVDLAAL